MERVFKTLQRRYRRTNLTFGQGLTEKGERREINHVFVKLMVLERGDLVSAFQNASFGTANEAIRRSEHVFTEVSRSAATARRCVELSEIFPDSASDDDSFRVLLLASAGCGKTTLLMKYCPLTWANGELWSGKFDLLICGELRNEEVRCAADIGGLLGGWGRVGLMNVEDRQSLVDFIADHPHRICLILDGLDETRFESCSNYVKDILRGEELHGVSLILTSRPCDDVFTLCEKYPFCTRLEIVGFLPADVEKYVRCVLSEEQATELLHVLAEDMHLASVMSTPYFAARVCELFKWSPRIPRCVSDIHELMILQIASSRGEKSFANWKDLPPDFQKQVVDLGEFAFRMLLAERLCFSESEIMAHSLSKEAVLLGMLVTCEPDLLVGRERQYRFSHLVLQEFLSALFVALSGQLYPGKIAKIVEALGALSGHLNTFWQLLASHLDSECMDCLCNALLLCPHNPLPVNETEALIFDRSAIRTKVQDTVCGGESAVDTTMLPMLDFAKGCKERSWAMVYNEERFSFSNIANIVFRCFMEYTRGAVPPARHLPVRTISNMLAKNIVGVEGHLSHAYCYTLQHVLKHHSDDVKEVQAYMSECCSWHWSLYHQVVKSSNLTTMKVSYPGYGDILPSSLSRNENMREAQIGDVPSRSLIAIAVAVEKWPSLRELFFGINDPDWTTDEEASAFLSAVGRHSSLRAVRIRMREMEQSHPGYRLCVQKSYPSTVYLQYTDSCFIHLDC